VPQALVLGRPGCLERWALVFGWWLTLTCRFLVLAEPLGRPVLRPVEVDLQLGVVSEFSVPTAPPAVEMWRDSRTPGSDMYAGPVIRGAWEPCVALEQWRQGL
jgi:hypothetical protein